MIITRNIDLSVGSMVGVVGLPHGGAAGRPSRSARAWLAIVVVHRDRRDARAGQRRPRRVRRVPSIIVTLGTLSIYRSVLTSHAGGRTINTAELPQWLVDLPRSTVFSARRLRGAHDVRACRGDHRRCCTWRCCTRGRPPSVRDRFKPRGRAAGRPQPASPAARGLRRRAAPSPGSRASSTSAASARSTSPPARASSWPRSPPLSSEA